MQLSFVNNAVCTKVPSKSFLERRCSTPKRLIARTAIPVQAYKAPSTAPSSSELDVLSSFSEVVPDTLLMQSLQNVEQPKAATVSSAVLSGILRNSSGLREYEVCYFLMIDCY